MMLQITSGTCHARIAPKIMLPPTSKARRRSPRRQTVMVASTEKMSSKSRLKLLIRPHGLGRPTGIDTISPFHEKWRMSVIVLKLTLTGEMKLKINTSVRRP